MELCFSVSIRWHLHLSSASSTSSWDGICLWYILHAGKHKGNTYVGMCSNQILFCIPEYSVLQKLRLALGLWKYWCVKIWWAVAHHQWLSHLGSTENWYEMISSTVIYRAVELHFPRHIWSHLISREDKRQREIEVNNRYSKLILEIPTAVVGCIWWSKTYHWETCQCKNKNKNWNMP